MSTNIKTWEAALHKITENNTNSKSKHYMLQQLGVVILKKETEFYKSKSLNQSQHNVKENNLSIISQRLYLKDKTETFSRGNCRGHVISHYLNNTKKTKSHFAFRN